MDNKYCTFACIHSPLSLKIMKVSGLKSDMLARYGTIISQFSFEHQTKLHSCNSIPRKIYPQYGHTTVGCCLPTLCITLQGNKRKIFLVHFHIHNFNLARSLNDPEVVCSISARQDINLKPYNVVIFLYKAWRQKCFFNLNLSYMC